MLSDTSLSKSLNAATQKQSRKDELKQAAQKTLDAKGLAMHKIISAAAAFKLVNAQQSEGEALLRSDIVIKSTLHGLELVLEDLFIEYHGLYQQHEEAHAAHCAVCDNDE